MSLFRSLAVGLLTVSSAGNVLADSVTSAGAQALYDQGKKLMASGNFAEACAKLDESQRLEPGGGTILLLARCHAKEGKTATSWAEYQEATRTAVRDNRKEREKVARDEGALVEPRLSKLVIDVTAKVPGLTIGRDGHEVGAGQWGLEVAVDPGSHTIVASAPDCTDWTTTVRVSKERDIVRVKVPALVRVAARSEGARLADRAVAARAEPLTSTEPRPDIPSGPGGAQRIAAAVAAGAGVVLVGAGALFALKARNTNAMSKEPDNCGTDNWCTPGGLDVRNDASAQARTATLLVAIGAAAVTGGAVLWLTASKQDAHVAMGLGPGQLVVSGGW